MFWDTLAELACCTDHVNSSQLILSFSLVAQPVLAQTLTAPGQDLWRGDSYGMHVESTSEWLVTQISRQLI